MYFIFAFFSIFFEFVKAMEPTIGARKRKRTDRYGDLGDSSSSNMDDMLEAIDESTSMNNEDSDHVDLSESSTDVSNRESVEKSTFKENGSQKSLERQLARIEAKANQMHSLLIQIQRACISNATSSLLESDRIDELPITSEEMLNKFEVDLSQDSYRKKIVSVSGIQILFLF